MTNHRTAEGSGGQTESTQKEKQEELISVFEHDPSLPKDPKEWPPEGLKGVLPDGTHYELRCIAQL